MKNVLTTDYPLRDQLLQVMIDNNASDMYITTGIHPAMKIAGEIIRIDDGIDVLTSKDTLTFAQSLISEKQHEKLMRDKNLDFSFGYGGARFRGNVSFQMGYYMLVIRLLRAEIPDIESLGLPDIYKDITKKGQGLILITGPTGSGKTTTLAAMIDYVNSNFKKHIITIEDPIEYVHVHKDSIIEQKEVGRDVPDYETALIGAMRQSPNIILFGEMRSKHEIEMALTLAETGHLVFSTMHTRSAAQTLSRILDIFPEGQKEQVRLQLADALNAIFSQRLLKLSDGTGVKMMKEILVNNTAIANLIRENEIHQIPTTMQMGRREGMQLLEDDIIASLAAGEIQKDEALKFSNNPQLIQEQL